MKAQFCPYCGARLDEGARFCKNCGEGVHGGVDESKGEESPTDSTEERKTVYAGTLYKCPSCGQPLASFVSICPVCGYEIRDAKSSSAVRELALKLEDIEAKRMPALEEKQSVMKMVFGRDFKKAGNEAEEAAERFDRQKADEKASLIINFSVPNTKEDIMEFMILAASNINVKKEIDDVVTKAWISKLDQVYQRAEITMGGHPDFMQIKSIYDHKKKELRNKKLKSVLGLFGCIAGWFFLLGLLWNPVATIGIVVGVLILIMIGVARFKKQ